MKKYPKNNLSKKPKPVLVFMHYFGGSGESWKKVIKKLETDYDCIAFTLPGFGQTESFKNPSIKKFAQFVLNELQVMKIKNYSLIGHSMGGKIALQMAASDKENKIQELILIAPSPPTTEPLTEHDKDQMLQHRRKGVAEKLIKNATVKKLSKRSFQVALHTQLSVADSTWKWWILKGMKNSIADKVKDLKIPITVIASKDDPVMTPKIIEKRVMANLKTAKLIQTSKCGHLIPLEKPKWLSEQIIQIIEKKR